MAPSLLAPISSCSICARETCDSPIPRDSDAKYIRADIYRLRESVYTAIYDILWSTFGEGSAAFNRSQQSLNQLTSTPDVIRGGRPAVVMEDDDDNHHGQLVCLATTYSGEDISKLPLIFRHFSIPIAPNDHMWHGYLDHLHALPEWDKKNAYLIGWPFRSTATRECLRTLQADGKMMPQVLGKEAMEFLNAECRRRREEWQHMCKDAARAVALEAEVRRHVRQRFGGHARGRASCESLASVNSVSWRRPGPAMIPEDPENNVFPAAFGKRHEPSTRKSTGKHGTGSTCSLTNGSAKKADADKKSIKSKGSRASLAQKSSTKGGLFNNFDVLRAVKVNAA